MADMSVVKFRFIPSEMFVDIGAAFGANATPMAYGEVNSVLQTSVIDGAENNWRSYDTSGQYGVAKCYFLNEHLIVPQILVMSKNLVEQVDA